MTHDEIIRLYEGTVPPNKATIEGPMGHHYEIVNIIAVNHRGFDWTYNVQYQRKLTQDHKGSRIVLQMESSHFGMFKEVKND